MIRLPVLLVFLLALIGLASAAPAVIPRASPFQQQQLACNGHPSLCSKSVTDVTFAGTHNSYSTGSMNPGTNQFTGITTQLQYGIRLINLDIHNWKDDLYLCHKFCWALSRGRAVDSLREIAAFMNSAEGSREVITIIFENAAKAGYDRLEKLLRDAGLAQLAYVQPSSSKTWPTLGSMIDSGKRLIVFADELPAPPANRPLPLVMSHFDYLSETPYSIRTESDWTCSLDRPRGVARPLVLVNHWLYASALGVDLPSANNAKKVNTASKLREHVSKCRNIRGQRINYILVDFYEYGDITEVVAGLNNVPFVPKTRPPTQFRLFSNDKSTLMQSPYVQGLLSQKKPSAGLEM
ncbi:PLC-like phosphodiesterase [Catenaria anguillulae PL171]|uniref:PLC-like phosphodiesterase n=1 Tax=Catenaria anguillulae PL171 TaxID=765915 RepID=A0A1Y2I159_9FUNG|nr:PLC-like phosphodiesterase [Catenaria anguillulae PL171]